MSFRSVTDEDLDERKACIELGFGFDSPEMDQRLSDTFLEIISSDSEDKVAAMGTSGCLCGASIFILMDAGAAYLLIG
ncbi:hypothetical protein BC332_18658 [Capsicum chinense]|nr:hypothetical protein BC332_18658 [Capsicum chinense]